MTLIGKLAKERKIYQKGKWNQQVKYKKMINLNTYYKILLFTIGYFTIRLPLKENNNKNP